MLCENKECLSCCACYAICPKGAITMQEDDLKKKIPIIDQSLCVHCGLCDKVCPQIQTIKRTKPISCYAGYIKDREDAIKSASGGFATEFSRTVQKKRGIVFGAVFQDGELVFSEGCDETFLGKLRGSKYVYSYTGKIYADIKNYLNAGNLCLFIGLPCQVAGLQTFLGKEYDNLVSIDLICHGAPPYRYLQEHIGSVIGDKSFERIAFRGEKHFYLTVFDSEDHEMYSKKQQEDEFFEAFMYGLLHRECCYSCPFSCDSRVSDITLGDFWGLANDALYGFKGRVSCALVNTTKGEALFRDVVAAGNITAEQRQISEAIAGNEQLRFPTRRPSERKLFEESYRSNCFSYAMKASGMSKRVKQLRVKNTILLVPRKMKRFVRNVLGK